MPQAFLQSSSLTYIKGGPANFSSVTSNLIFSSGLKMTKMLKIGETLREKWYKNQSRVKDNLVISSWHKMGEGLSDQGWYKSSRGN